MIDVCDSCRSYGRNPHGHTTEDCPFTTSPSDWTILFRKQLNECYQRLIGPFACQVSPVGYWNVRAYGHVITNGIGKNLEDGKRAAVEYVTNIVFQMCDHMNLDRPTEKIDTLNFMF